MKLTVLTSMIAMCTVAVNAAAAAPSQISSLNTPHTVALLQDLVTRLTASQKAINGSLATLTKSSSDVQKSAVALAVTPYYIQMNSDLENITARVIKDSFSASGKRSAGTALSARQQDPIYQLQLAIRGIEQAVVTQLINSPIGFNTPFAPITGGPLLILYVIAFGGFPYEFKG